MMDFNQLNTMDSQDVVSLTKLLLAVALSDGTAHQAEVALIQAFYDGCSEGEDIPAFSELNTSVETAGSDSLLANVSFTDSQVNDVALSMMIMTALADGSLGDEEHKAILKASASMGIDEAQVATRIDQVKDTMLSQLSHLPDSATVVDVSRELNQ